MVRWLSPAEGDGFENRYTRKGIGGSNPSLTAESFFIEDLDTLNFTEVSGIQF